jgi:hypothetical protein
LPVHYNLVHGVGKNAPNDREDVMLVQYLLAMVYVNAGTPRKGDLVIGGVCGPINKNWIQKFQFDIRNLSQSIIVDDRADRTRNFRAISKISKTTYTIIWLNYIAAGYDPETWANIVNVIPLTDKLDVPPPEIDNIPEPVDLPQTTSPGGPQRLMPSVLSSTPSSDIPATGDF